jgi:hypothetical protein
LSLKSIEYPKKLTKLAGLPSPLRFSPRFIQLAPSPSKTHKCPTLLPNPLLEEPPNVVVVSLLKLTDFPKVSRSSRASVSPSPSIAAPRCTQEVAFQSKMPTVPAIMAI